MPDREADHQEPHGKARKHPRLAEQLPRQEAIEEGPRQVEDQLDEEEEVLAHGSRLEIRCQFIPGFQSGVRSAAIQILPGCQPTGCGASGSAASRAS